MSSFAKRWRPEQGVATVAGVADLPVKTRAREEMAAEQQKGAATPSITRERQRCKRGEERQIVLRETSATPATPATPATLATLPTVKQPLLSLGEPTKDRPPGQADRIGSCLYCRDAVYNDDVVHANDGVLHDRCVELWAQG